MGVGHAHALYVHEHSPVHRLAPEVKVASVLVFVVAVAVTPPEAVPAFVFYAVSALGVVIVSRIPIGFLLLRLAGILPFILFAFFIPFIGTGERVDLFWLTVSRDGLWAAWNIVAKATIGATASIILVATTEVTGILKGMSALRVPAVVVSIAGFMVRYLELIVDELGRMRMAMTARGHDPRWLWQVRPIATGAGAMFVRSYERGERVHAAMTSRGFTGEMPILDTTRPGWAVWAKALSIPLAAVVVAALAVVRW
jgi:cobalt/nickel transport system permease protein